MDAIKCQENTCTYFLRDNKVYTLLVKKDDVLNDSESIIYTKVCVRMCSDDIHNGDFSKPYVHVVDGSFVFIGNTKNQYLCVPVKLLGCRLHRYPNG